MTTHTPGPWRFSGMAIYNAEATLPSHKIASMSCSLKDAHEMQANARLIAAAPDLLESLQEILNIGTDLLPSAQYRPIINRAKKAVAKANAKD